jgi:carbonic anhydrase
MCDAHESKDSNLQQISSKRSFLKLAAASTLGFGIVGAMGTFAMAAPLKGIAPLSKNPPLPENVLTPDAALERLMEGNLRYVSGKSKPLDFASERDALSEGQNPFASILSCSDSRVSPEFCFDEQRGDLFVARVAGNYLTTDFIATMEYAVAMLRTPLIMVLGHESCGAVGAAINAVDKHEQFPGHIQSLATALVPAVKAAKDMPGKRYDNIVKMNVILTVEQIKNSEPILSHMIEHKKIRVVGGVYSLKTGKVDLVA